MKKYLVKIAWISAMAWVFVLSSCQLEPNNRWSRTSTLRGNVFLDIEFPLSALVPKDVEIRGPAREGLSVSTEHRVSRSVIPIDSSTPIRRAMIPDHLWQPLLALQEDWCDQPPVTAYTTYDPSRYEITLKCAWGTPVYSLTSTDLPRPITQLMEFIP